MTLAEFRRLTAHLAGERELLCAGAGINIVWHDETDYVSIDDGYVDVDDDGVVLWQDCPERSLLYQDAPGRTSTGGRD